MNVVETVSKLIDSADAGKVFGAPVRENGLTLVPVAKMRGGGGGGGSEEGNGGGMGLTARGLGVFVIGHDGRVRWHPAIDATAVIVAGSVALYLLARIVKRLTR
jgi:uncharacterized spore protein YtfJ